MIYISRLALPTEPDSFDAFSSLKTCNNTQIHSKSFAVTAHSLYSPKRKKNPLAMPPKGSTIHPPKPPADAPPTAASIQMKANSLGIGEYELPKTTLTKLAKGSVSQSASAGRGGGVGRGIDEGAN